MPVTKASLPSAKESFHLDPETRQWFISLKAPHVFNRTRLFEGQSVTRHRDLLLRGPDPVQHAPPALHGEGEVGACGRWPLVDAQHYKQKKVGQFVKKNTWKCIFYFLLTLSFVHAHLRGRHRHGDGR